MLSVGDTITVPQIACLLVPIYYIAQNTYSLLFFFKVDKQELRINTISQSLCENVDGSKYSHGALELACQADVCKPSHEINQELPNICLHCTKLE